MGHCRVTYLFPSTNTECIHALYNLKDRHPPPTTNSSKKILMKYINYI